MFSLLDMHMFRIGLVRPRRVVTSRSLANLTKRFHEDTCKFWNKIQGVDTHDLFVHHLVIEDKILAVSSKMTTALHFVSYGARYIITAKQNYIARSSTTVALSHGLVKPLTLRSAYSRSTALPESSCEC